MMMTARWRPVASAEKGDNNIDYDDNNDDDDYDYDDGQLRC